MWVHHSRVDVGPRACMVISLCGGLSVGKAHGHAVIDDRQRRGVLTAAYLFTLVEENRLTIVGSKRSAHSTLTA